MKYVYVACKVRKDTPESQALLNMLAEKATGKPQPDIIREYGPASLSFEHHFIEANNDSEAYTKGGKLVTNVQRDWDIFNDYVIVLP